MELIDLPDEIIFQIFKNLDFKNLLLLELVCKYFKYFIRSIKWCRKVTFNDNKIFNNIIKNHNILKCKLSFINLKCIRYLDNPVHLNLSHMKNIRCIDVNELKNCICLNLSHTDIDDKFIKLLPKFKKLNLSCTAITDECIEYLLKYKYVNLSYTNISIKKIEYLINNGVIVKY